MRFCVALLFAALLPACTPSPGVDLHVVVQGQAVGPAAQMVITAVSPGGALGMQSDTSANGVAVHTDGAGRVTLTFTTPGFAIRDAFDILLVPTTATPVNVAFTGKLYQGDGQLLAIATSSETVSASLTARKTVTVSFHCVTTACTAVPAGDMINLASSPSSSTDIVLDVTGAAGGDKLQPIAVGRFTPGSTRGDLVVAAPTKNVTVGSKLYSNAGAVYLLHGQDWSVFGLKTHDVADTDADLTIVGAEGDGLGSAAAIGDFDGDGTDDLAVAGITASRPDTPPPGLSYAAAGVVYVFTAKRMQAAMQGPGQHVIDLNDATTWQATPRIYGSVGQERLGSALAFGHLSSPAVTDLIVGAPGAEGSGGAPKAGRVYVIDGLDALWAGDLLVQITDPQVSAGSAQSVTLLGTTTNAPIGQALAAADLDGDGKVEVAIGNYLDGGKGSVKIFTGAHLLKSSTFDLVSQAADATALGTSGSQLGWAVAFGDVEGTGSRMLVATSRANGVVYTFPTTMLGGTTLDVGQGQFRLALVGPKGAGFGSSMALANLDGDAAANLLIGAPASSGLDGTRTASGAVYVVTGEQMLSSATASQNNTVMLAQKAPALTIYGAQKGDSLGNHVTAGNLDISTATSQLVLGADSGGLNAQGVVYAIQKLPPP